VKLLYLFRNSVEELRKVLVNAFEARGSRYRLAMDRNEVQALHKDHEDFI
jgi:hypothetical protein